MRDIFLADAHLLDPADANYRRLLAFLEKQRGEIGTLYLLGDIFEFWVGYRHTIFAPYVPLLETLRRLREAGTEIVYVEGNHDFHLGPYIEGTLGCTVLPDGGPVEIGGQRIFLAHGDLADPEDRGYRLLRSFLRSRAARWLMTRLSPNWTWAIALWAGRRSRERRAGGKEKVVPREKILDYARHYFGKGYDAVVMGHFHAPFLSETGIGTLVALGDWISQYSYAVFEDGRFRLEKA
jgi:UDP-2,3-diacylglucosamine hydrolase